MEYKIDFWINPIMIFKMNQWKNKSMGLFNNFFKKFPLEKHKNNFWKHLARYFWKKNMEEFPRQVFF